MFLSVGIRILMYVFFMYRIIIILTLIDDFCMTLVKHYGRNFRKVLYNKA